MQGLHLSLLRHSRHSNFNELDAFNLYDGEPILPLSLYIVKGDEHPPELGFAAGPGQDVRRTKHKRAKDQEGHKRTMGHEQEEDRSGQKVAEAIEGLQACGREMQSRGRQDQLARLCLRLLKPDDLIDMRNKIVASLNVKMAEYLRCKLDPTHTQVGRH